MSHRTGTPCRHCGCNMVNHETTYAETHSQIICANCGVRGPRISYRDGSTSRTLDQMYQLACAGWIRLNR